MRIRWSGDNADEIVLNACFVSPEPVEVHIDVFDRLSLIHKGTRTVFNLGDWIVWMESNGGWFGNWGQADLQVEEKKSIIGDRLVVDNYMLAKPLLDKLAENQKPWWRKLWERAIGWVR